MAELNALALFAAVVDAGSFTLAAARLGTTQSALSHGVRRLETRLGVRLLNRTTRSLAPTEAGARLCERLAPLLESVNEGLAELLQTRDGPGGRVRISSADHIAETVVWPRLSRLLAQHPGIHVELDVDNQLVDIVAQRYDAGIRLGNNLAKDMVAVPISAAQRVVVVAAPNYLRGRQPPRHPQDLADHECIARRTQALGAARPWEFTQDGATLRVPVAGRLTFNRPELVVQAALAGFGLAYLLESQVASLLATGQLVRVLDDWSATLPAYYLYYPSRRQPTRAFQLVVEALKATGEG